MLNVLDDMAAALRSGGFDEAYKRAAQINQAHLDASRRTPYRQVAGLLGAIYLVAMVGAACITRFLSHIRPDPLVRRLAEHYVAVPEMVLHKAIELGSLRKRSFKGRGLDLGCGDGIVGGELIREADIAELHGTDLSPYPANTAPGHGYASFRVGDLQSLPFQDNEFDYVVCVCVIEHVRNLDKVLSEARRVLKPGGAFYFTTPAAGYQESMVAYRALSALKLTARAELFKSLRDVMSLHYHCYTADEWRRRLAAAGFCDIVVDPIFTRRQMFTYDLMNIQLYFLKFYFYEHIRAWTNRSRIIQRVARWAAAELCGHFAANIATFDDSTHHSIACKRL